MKKEKIKAEVIDWWYKLGTGKIYIVKCTYKERQWFVVGYDAWKLEDGRTPSYATYEASTLEEAEGILKEVYF